ncbi:unnamed protein product [Sphenostylis stenocarpa]|uniref:PIN-like protein n=1 Tax=Sphenostylis stenocarpa TaxID=92480 RepID=A0AA86SJQ9_9FABA|nr:unnamed protein product [Sphenostylis stenocarpa]
MGFWKLLEVASAPILEVLLISAVGVFLATDYCNNVLSADFRKSLNKIVFIAFTPALIFASFAENVSLDDMILWYHSIKVVVVGKSKIWKDDEEEGNMGNLPIVIMPAICDEKGGPFGEPDDCRNRALSYSFCSLALGGVFIWTYTYQLMRNTSLRYKAFEAAEILKIPNKRLDADAETGFLKQNGGYAEDTENQILVDRGTSLLPIDGEKSLWHRTMETVGQILAELMSPPTVATLLGFLFGGVKWLRNLIIGHDAPLRVIQGSIQLLGDGTIPCITVLLGGNLTQAMDSSGIQPLILICIIVARLVLLPAIGLFVVKGAANFGLLPLDPLFQYVLVMQYALPPAMNISTMAQLFDVGTEEFSVILLWTYGAASIAGGKGKSGSRFEVEDIR